MWKEAILKLFKLLPRRLTGGPENTGKFYHGTRQLRIMSPDVRRDFVGEWIFPRPVCLGARSPKQSLPEDSVSQPMLLHHPEPRLLIIRDELMIWAACVMTYPDSGFSSRVSFSEKQRYISPSLFLSRLYTDSGGVLSLATKCSVVSSSSVFFCPETAVISEHLVTFVMSGTRWSGHVKYQSETKS